MKIRNAMKRISALGVVFVAVGVSVFLVVKTGHAEGGDMHYTPGCKYVEGGLYGAPSSYGNSSNSNGLEGWSSVMTKVASTKNVPEPGKTYSQVGVLGMYELINGYSDTIYAKKGDAVTYTHCLFPGAQYVANTYVTYPDTQHYTNLDNYPHSTTESGLRVMSPLSQKTVEKLTNDEINDGKHKQIYDKDGHPDWHAAGWKEFVDRTWTDQEWTTIPNFSRVINLFGVYGGLNIYGNVSESAVGKTEFNQVDNIFVVGGSDQPIASVGKFTETHLLPQPNHIKVTSGTHRWSCSYRNNGQCNYCADSRFSVRNCPPNLLRSPSRCFATCSHGQNRQEQEYIKAEVDYDESAPNRSEASVIVPYNYALNATIDIEGDRVFAGETAKLINTKVGAWAKFNSLTKGTYITDVPYAKARVVTYYSNDPNGSGGSNYQRGEFIEHETGSTSLDLNTSEWPWTFPENTVNVYDNYAGKYFCAFLEFYPQTSGDDKFDKSGYLVGDNKTGTSNRVCKPIAKKPSLQIWGGSLYSAGNISLLRATKNNLMNVAGREYSVDRADNVNVFSSWGELSVTSIGGIKGFASGGATSDSYRDKDNSQISYGKLEPNEQRVSGFCKYESPLTYANYSTAFGICGSGAVDTAGMFASKATKVDKYSYIEEIVGNKLNLKDDSSVVPNLTSNDTITIGVSESAKGKVAFHTVTSKTNKKLLITKSNNIITIDRSLSTRAVPKGQTYLIYTTKQVKINDDIIYEGGYSKIEDMPKVVIYANTIAISCNVSRVDAVLIAVDWVSTCYEDTNRQDKQLMINGTVIADRMYAPREFGAGPGKYSGIPAEIINYDSSLVLWGQRKADATESGIFNTAYVRELAPRY